MKRIAWIAVVLSLGCTGTLDAGGDVSIPMDGGASVDALAADGADALPVDGMAVDAAADVAGPTGTCENASDSVNGAVTCRDETERCTLSQPNTTTCAESCLKLGLTCLRAYQEADNCFPAVELGQLACDAAPEDRALCQCGDAGVEHEPWSVVTIGDSTMSNTGTPGELGWGDALPMFGERPEDVHNEGSSGASSLDFETRSNWPRAQALLGPNVFLLIQFGHNDGSSDTNRHTEPGTAPDYLGTYRDRLAFYVAAAREAGATPLIATSVGHMSFNDDGTTSDTGTIEYVRAARKYAADEGLPLIDGHIGSRREFERLGRAETRARYSFDEPTHFTPEGAIRIAELMAHLGCVENETFCAQFSIP